MDDVTEQERKATARQVADEILAKLEQDASLTTRNRLAKAGNDVLQFRIDACSGTL